MDTGEAADSEAALAANDAFYEAFVARDIAAMESLWARKHTVSCIHPGWNVLSGREAVLQSWRGILANPDQPRIVSGGASVHLLGDTAIVTCRELVSGSPLVATNIFIREGSAWRLLLHHSSPVMA